MKRILTGLAALALTALAAPTLAANCSNYPFILANGQTADATQVMSNFNNMLSCANANLARQGSNSDITSLSGLLTPLSVSQGGTGQATTAAYAATLQTFIPFEFYTFIGGTTGNAWNLAAYTPSSSLVLSTAKSACVAGTAATASTTYTLKDNGSSIGTAVISAGTTTCVATITSSPYTVTAGHVLTLVGPLTADVTAADVGITFGGTRN